MERRDEPQSAYADEEHKASLPSAEHVVITSIGRHGFVVGQAFGQATGKQWGDYCLKSQDRNGQCEEKMSGRDKPCIP